MAKLDNTITERIQKWLSEDHSSAEKICEGADLLLLLNRNRVLNANIKLKPERPAWKEKLEYELKKYLGIRLDGLTRDGVIRLDARVTAEAEQILADGSEDTDPADGSVILTLKGKRQDHDALPEHVKRLFEDNHDRYQRIRALHATLRSMEGAQSCDRYEYLKQLDELDSNYRKNLAKYDAYVIENSGDGGSAGDSEKKEDDHQVVTVNRTWISRNKSKLAKLKEAADADQNDMLAQQDYGVFLGVFNGKVTEVIANGGTFGAKLGEELESLGVVFPEVEHHTDEPETVAAEEDPEGAEVEDNMEGDGSAE